MLGGGAVACVLLIVQTGRRPIGQQMQVWRWPARNSLTVVVAVVVLVVAMELQAHISVEEVHQGPLEGEEEEGSVITPRTKS